MDLDTYIKLDREEEGKSRGGIIIKKIKKGGEGEIKGEEGGREGGREGGIDILGGVFEEVGIEREKHLELVVATKR